MLRLIYCTLGLLVLCGCDMVLIDKPIGKEFTSEEKTSLVGGWITDDGALTEVRKTKQDQLVLGSLSWDAKENKFKAETSEFTMTTIGQTKYAFGKMPDGDYSFCRYVRTDEATLELNLPDPQAFRKVVQESIAAAKGDQSKALGEVEETKPNYAVKLFSDSKALLEFFESPKIDACFDKKRTLRYKRIHSRN